jgi:peptide/nickel transport system substrate-binding protein
MSRLEDDRGPLGELTRRQALARLGAGGAALALPALLAACGGKGRTAGGTGGRASDREIASLTWAMGGAPPSLDLAQGFTVSAALTIGVGLEGLLTIGDRLALEPLLARSWSQPDPLHYVYELRPGVRFWDGTPLSAEDVAFSLQRHLDPKLASQLGPLYANVRSVQVSAPDRITVTMSRPDPLFQYVPAFSFVTPRALARRLGRRLGAPGSKVQTMGTGPYRITRFSSEGATVERRSGYWGARPAVRRAQLRYIANPQTQLLGVRSGDVDGAFDFPVSQARDWDRTSSVRTAYAPGLEVAFLSFDLSAAPWNDVHVRRAVAHAADREGYVKAFLAGHGRPASALVAPAQWAGVAAPDEVASIYRQIPQYPFDLDRARAELARSAHPRGFRADVQFPDAIPEPGKALVSLSQTLKPLGIDLRVRQVSVAKYQADYLRHRDLGLQYGGLGPDYPDPADYLVQLLPASAAVENGLNTANYRSPVIDRLLREQAAATDRAARAAAIARILRIVGEELPYLPLWWQDSSLGLRSRYVLPGFNSLFYYSNWLAKVRARA